MHRTSRWKPAWTGFASRWATSTRSNPANIVGAIANEADLDSKFIGRIEIFDDYSLVDLPEDMPERVAAIRVEAGSRLPVNA